MGVARQSTLPRLSVGNLFALELMHCRVRAGSLVPGSSMYPFPLKQDKSFIPSLLSVPLIICGVSNARMTQVSLAFSLPPLAPMAERQRREASTARPGDIVNNAKQKRRSKDEIAQENLAAQAKKDAKAKEKEAKRKSGVKRAAAAEDKLRKQDEHDRATAARPDLVTAQLKRVVPAEAPADDSKASLPILFHCIALNYCQSAASRPKPSVARPKPAAATPPSIESPSHSVMAGDQDVSIDEDITMFGGGSEGDNDNEIEDGGDGAENGDKDYIDSGGENGYESGGEGGEGDVSAGEDEEEEEEMRRQIEEFAKKLKAKKQREQAAKTKTQKV